MTLPDLRGLAAGRYRTGWDPAYAAESPRFRAQEAPWLVRIPCRRGAFIGVHGQERLCAFSATRGMAARLLALPDVVAHQHGDVEILVTFPPSRLDAVAELLGARRVPQLSDEERARRAERMRQIRASQAARENTTFAAAPAALGAPALPETSAGDSSATTTAEPAVFTGAQPEGEA